MGVDKVKLVTEIVFLQAVPVFMDISLLRVLKEKMKCLFVKAKENPIILQSVRGTCSLKFVHNVSLWLVVNVQTAFICVAHIKPSENYVFFFFLKSLLEL